MTQPMMSKRHFELIAEVLAQERSAAQILDRGDDAVRQTDIIISNFAGRLAQTNPRFDKDRFIAAAKGEQ